MKKSEKNKVLAGIFGGIGEYFNVDPVLLRLLGLLLCLVTGIIPFLVVYIIAAMIVPKEEGKEKEATSLLRKWWFWVIVVIILFLFVLPVIALLGLGHKMVETGGPTKIEEQVEYYHDDVKELITKEEESLLEE